MAIIHKLCKTCEERKFCTELCLEALVAQQEDHSDNYVKEAYKPVGMPTLCRPKGENDEQERSNNF